MSSREGPAFVGRGPELNVLRHALKAADAGTLRCWLLVGAPGAGKTSLAREFSARASKSGAVALSARARDPGDTGPFRLWSEALDGHLRHLEPGVLSGLCGEFAPDLATLLPSVASLVDTPIQGGAPQL